MRGADPYQLPVARKLRGNATAAEKRLWEQLRARQLGGFKFVRQAPVGPFVADFLCRECKLIIELDGATHSTPEEIAHDESRTSYLTSAGYRVLRFENNAAFEGMDGVLAAILDLLRRTDSITSQPSYGRNR